MVIYAALSSSSSSQIDIGKSNALQIPSRIRTDLIFPDTACHIAERSTPNRLAISPPEIPRLIISYLIFSLTLLIMLMSISQVVTIVKPSIHTMRIC